MKERVVEAWTPLPCCLQARRRLDVRFGLFVESATNIRRKQDAYNTRTAFSRLRQDLTRRLN
jgi:hypothetical protein